MVPVHVNSPAQKEAEIAIAEHQQKQFAVPIKSVQDNLALESAPLFAQINQLIVNVARA